MTELPIHPEAEDLGRFLEGTVSAAERTAIVTHLASCDDCRMIVADTAEFTAKPAAAIRSTSTQWWAMAAALVLVVGVAAYVWNARRDPLEKVERAYGQLQSRPIEGALNGFPYRERQSLRGPELEDDDPATGPMKGKAADVLENVPGDNARSLHARGVAKLLLKGKEDAAADLAAAARQAPDEAGYWNDLAVAQIANGHLAQAVAAADRALQLDSHFAAAMFNKGTALMSLNKRSEAIQEYESFLRTAPDSSWAPEVRQRLTDLKIQ